MGLWPQQCINQLDGSVSRVGSDCGQVGTVRGGGLWDVSLGTVPCPSLPLSLPLPGCVR